MPSNTQAAMRYIWLDYSPCHWLNTSYSLQMNGRQDIPDRTQFAYEWSSIEYPLRDSSNGPVLIPEMAHKSLRLQLLTQAPAAGVDHNTPITIFPIWHDWRARTYEERETRSTPQIMDYMHRSSPNSASSSRGPHQNGHLDAIDYFYYRGILF